MDQTGNLASQVAGATYDYFIYGNGSGTSMTYDGKTYYTLAAFDAANGDSYTIQDGVIIDNNLDGGSEIQQFTVELNLASAAYFNGTSANLSLAGSTDTDASSQVANTAGIGSSTNVFFSANRNALTTAEIENSPMTANSLTFGAGTGTNTDITLSSDSTADSLTIEGGGPPTPTATTPATVSPSTAAPTRSVRRWFWARRRHGRRIPRRN